MTRVRRAPYRLLFLWLCLMLLPVVLTVDAPNNLRAIGALPAVCAFIGVGAAWCAETAARASGRIRPLGGRAVMIGRVRFWLALELAAILVLSGGLTTHMYFVRWARLPEMPESLDDPWRRIATAILDTTQESDLYVPYEIVTNPVVRFLLYDRYPSLQPPPAPVIPSDLRQPAAMISLELPAQGPFVLLTGGEMPHGYVLGSITEKTRSQIYSRLFGSRNANNFEIKSSQGRDLAAVFPLSPSDAALFPREITPADRLERRFVNGVRLVGYSLEPSIARQGQQFILTLYWQADRLIEDEFEVFVHLTDRTSSVRSQGNSLPLAGSYTGTLWAPGEIVPDPHTVVVPDDLPPGKVRFEIGLLLPGSHDRISMINEKGEPAGDQVTLATALVVEDTHDTGLADHASPPATEPSSAPIDIRFGSGISLTNIWAGGTPGPGEQVWLDLEWHALNHIDEDYTLFVHMVDRAGKIVVQQDQPPQAGANPTSWWIPGETIKDRITLNIPVDARNAPYQYFIGLYQAASGKRLSCEGDKTLCQGDYLALPASPAEPGS